MNPSLQDGNAAKHAIRFMQAAKKWMHVPGTSKVCSHVPPVSNSSESQGATPAGRMEWSATRASIGSMVLVCSESLWMLDATGCRVDRLDRVVELLDHPVSRVITPGEEDIASLCLGHIGAAALSF